MNNSYLKNLLDKNSQSNLFVEPRLKSRFEASNGLSRDEGFVDTFDKENRFIQKDHPIVESSSEEEKKDVPETIQPINSEKTIVNNNHEHQTKFLNTTEHHLLSLENNNTIKENVEPMPSKTTNVEKVIIKASNPNPEGNLESITYGLLNKPVKTIANKEKRFNRNNDAISKENHITTESLPSIKISIGRVEVKAVNKTQKVSSKPKTKANLKLSLQDYINQRK